MSTKLVDTLRAVPGVEVVEWNEVSASCYVTELPRVYEVIEAVEKSTGDVFVKRVSPPKDFGWQGKCFL